MKLITKNLLILRKNCPKKLKINHKFNRNLTNKIKKYKSQKNSYKSINNNNQKLLKKTI